MIRSMSTLFVVLLNAALLAQAPDTLWSKTIGGNFREGGNSVRQTADGGYIIVGGIRSSVTGPENIWLIRTDANGDTLWTKTFGGSSDDAGNSIQQTSDGGFIIAGYTNSFGAGGTDVWLIKTDANGGMLWTKTFGDSTDEGGNSIDTTSDGGFIITGFTHSFPSVSDVWLIKTDANGDTIWTKTFGDSEEIDRGYAVEQTIDSGYVLTGIMNETFGPNGVLLGGLVWLIKTDAQGDTMWTKTFEDSNANWGNSVQQTADGGYIILGVKDFIGGYGYFKSSDIWLIKTNIHGDSLWTKSFGKRDYPQEIGNSVQQTNDSGYIFETNTYGLIKTDANGDTLWTKMFGYSNDVPLSSVQQTRDGGYIITGAKSGDVWLAKVAPDITAINENQPTSIKDYRLQQNYPNPFNPTTHIEFSISKSKFVTLKIYNILGEEVATLVSERLTAGKYQYDWDAGHFASGVYLYRMTVGGHTQIRKMVLIK